MDTITQSPYTHEQIKVWMRGLLTLAWADGHFDAEEKDLIIAITEDELAPAPTLTISTPSPLKN